ncbi:MAG: polar amino acid transport system substrate-binding protein [Acidimicrobiaceae bacterium]
MTIVVACSSASPAPTTTTTTAPAPAASAGATTTTVEPTTLPGSEGFHTRRPGTLIIGTERLERPWYIGPSAELVTGGFEFDLASELARRLRVPSIQVVQSSLVLMMTGQDCKCDVMLGGITITDARARALDLSEPYLGADQGVVVRKGTVVDSVAAAAALRWAVTLRNPTGIEVIRTRVKPSTEPEVVVNNADGVRLLAEGRVDALMLETPDALVIAEANPALAVAGQFRTGEQYALALSLGSPNTALINDVIREMRNDGTVDLLLRAYFGVEPANVPAIPP